jgi:hypothetical protein
LQDKPVLQNLFKMAQCFFDQKVKNNSYKKASRMRL